MDKKLLKEEYKRLLTKAIEGRPGGMALMIALEETDFYNSPASAKHHLNVPGGLLLHSLNVARAALELCENMPQFARCDRYPEVLCLHMADMIATHIMEVGE